MADQSKDFLQRLLTIFRNEASEHLQDIESGFVQLEQATPEGWKDLVERMLKRLHTLKGAARAVSQAEMEALCHALESVLSTILESRQPLQPEEFDLVHQAGAIARALLQSSSGRTRNQASALTARLNQLAEQLRDYSGVSRAEPMQPGVTKHKLPASETNEQADAPAPAETVATREPDFVRVQSSHLDAIRYQVEGLLEHELELQHHFECLMAVCDELASTRQQAQFTASGADLPAPRQSAVPAGGESWHSPRLEQQLRQLALALDRSRRNFSTARGRLMTAALEMALVPFSTATAQLPALVRNLARKQGKEVLLQVTGEGILVDRKVLSAVSDALIHLVTNAVDHGIELPAMRIAAGKPAAGTITVDISQNNSSQVSLVVKDDGAGMNVSNLIDAAQRGGSLSLEQIRGLDEQQIVRLALKTGVSTRASITSVSGRGVGLAVVAEKVSAVSGQLDIDNLPGHGCAFRLSLPVRLASLRVLVLRMQNHRYVLPLTGVEHVWALQEGDLRPLENRETVPFRGRVVAAVRLAQLLGHAAKESAEHIAILAHAGGQTLALLVDEVLGEQEVLPKHLGCLLRNVRFVTGAARLGDGSLVPVLGLEDLARYGLLGTPPDTMQQDAQAGRVIKKRVLVVDDSVTSRLLLKHILEGADYHVDTAADGLDALSRLRQQDFDAVISDIEMPRMDGLALTMHIRADPKTAEMPVVLVTSLQSPREKERGLQAGADAYVVKGSFDQDNLLETLRRLV